MMGDRFPEPIRARTKIYNVRVTGPSTDGDEVAVHGLPLDNVVTALLMLQAGDCAVVDCAEETTDWGEAAMRPPRQAGDEAARHLDELRGQARQLYEQRTGRWPFRRPDPAASAEVKAAALADDLRGLISDAHTAGRRLETMVREARQLGGPERTP